MQHMTRLLRAVPAADCNSTTCRIHCGYSHQSTAGSTRDAQLISTTQAHQDTAYSSPSLPTPHHHQHTSPALATGQDRCKQTPKCVKSQMHCQETPSMSSKHNTFLQKTKGGCPCQKLHGASHGSKPIQRGAYASGKAVRRCCALTTAGSCSYCSPVSPIRL